MLVHKPLRLSPLQLAYVKELLKYRTVSAERLAALHLNRDMSDTAEKKLAASTVARLRRNLARFSLTITGTASSGYSMTKNDKESLRAQLKR